MLGCFLLFFTSSSSSSSSFFFFFARECVCVTLYFNDVTCLDWIITAFQHSITSTLKQSY